MEEINTKEKILKGATDLFIKYGIRSISMDDIARHLTVSKKTLYQHFVDKDELVTTVLHSHLEEQKKIFEQISQDSENAIDELHRLGECLRKQVQDSNPSVLFDIQKFHPKAWAIWVEYKKDFIRCSVVRNVVQGIKDGHFRPEMNPEIFASYRLAAIETVHDERIFPKDKFNMTEVHFQIFEHFVYGLCTEKGKKLYQKYKENNHKPQLSNESIL
ncbi:TetR family transcriptional regulator [Cytophagales bacterium WSM2-2]|nr:TetR family transcriptional regulator [Cytophagales bacterium WSM2-2]